MPKGEHSINPNPQIHILKNDEKRHVNSYRCIINKRGLELVNSSNIILYKIKDTLYIETNSSNISNNIEIKFRRKDTFKMTSGNFISKVNYTGFYTIIKQSENTFLLEPLENQEDDTSDTD